MGPAATLTTDSYNVTSHMTTPYNMNRFIVLESSVAVFTVMMTYMIVALLCFECGKSQLSSLLPQSRAERSARFAFAMRLAYLVAVLFTLGRLLCEHYELLAQYFGIQHDYCNTIVKIKVALSAIAILGIYVFLWIRQRFCYSDPAMAHLSSRATRYLSIASLALLILAQLVGSVLFLATRFYKITYRGCYNYANTIPAELPWIWNILGTLGSQIMLLLLFLYPLTRHKSLVSSTTPFRTFLPVIQRAMVTASICVVSDLVSSLLILLVSDTDDIIPTLAYDISIVINVICVILSYSDWKSRIFAPFRCRYHNRRTANGEPSVYGMMKSTGANGSRKAPLSSPIGFRNSPRTLPSPQLIGLNIEPQPSMGDAISFPATSYASSPKCEETSNNGGSQRAT